MTGSDSREPRLAELAGRRLAIWGLGEEGWSVLRALDRRLPDQPVTVLDERPLPTEAEESLRHFPQVTTISGPGAGEAARRFEVLIKSPGVSLYRREIAAAIAGGTLVTSATRLWLAEVAPPSFAVAVTGSKGKSTTASLLAAMLAAGGARVELGGNIGRPLLDLLDQVEAPEVWVVELSSYQTADLATAPDWAVLLNLFPEHLDWHGGLEPYYRDKLRLFRRLAPGRAVVRRGDPEIERRLDAFREPLFFDDRSGFHEADGGIADGDERLVAGDELRLIGRHNRINACAALTVTRELGTPRDAALAALRAFPGIRHRLSVLGERHGLLWVDDSIATVPQAAIAALDAFPGRPVTLLLGGFDRGLPYDGLARALVERGLETVVTLPDSGSRIAGEIERARAAAGADRPRVLAADGLESAVEVARRETPAGGVVLLSPAAASFGRFADYRARGRAFAAAAGFTVLPQG